jgi:hypothetical protein
VGSSQRPRRHGTDDAFISSLIQLRDEPAAEELAGELGNLPLAIVQAGAYVAVRKMSFENYFQTYKLYFYNFFEEKLSNVEIKRSRERYIAC